MPPLLSIPDVSTLINQNITVIRSIALPSNANSTGEALRVICAWPVSGQYGPGTRILYYALIAACLLARRAEWLVNACLAAALLLPAIAAIHGIVLTALHVHNAVDMDIYGAFQLCSIGILAAPVTVMMSRTYFNDPGRNTIFLWALLILVGMLCLAIEFYRTETFDCTHPTSTTPMSLDASKFPLGNNSVCGLPFHCSTTNGPVSPMRGGAADNVYIIPVPDKLTFGTATLLAAACCVHTVLCLVSMWDKIVEINWRRRSRRRDQNDSSNKVIEGTNGATPAMMKGINGRIQYFLRVIAIPIFGGVGLAILILGEINFYSRQVRYQTEPIASVGQWAPICGTFMAMVGSLYLLLAADVEAVKEGIRPDSSDCQCTCSPHVFDEHSSTGSPPHSRSSSMSSHRRNPYCRNHQDHRQRRSTGLSGHSGTRREFSPSMLTRSGSEGNGSQVQIHDSGNRHKVASFLISMGELLGSPTRDFFNDSFRRGAATGYPEVPGELARNRYLGGIRERYSRQSEASRTRENSAAVSYAASDASGCGSDRESRSHRTSSPEMWRMQSPHAAATHVEDSSVQFEMVQRVHTTPAVGSTFEKSCQRRNTLEIPSPTYHPSRRG